MHDSARVAPSDPGRLAPDALRGIIGFAEEPSRRLAARALADRDETAVRIARGEGVTTGLGGQRLGGQGVSLLAVAATSAAVILSAEITASALFGGGLLRSFGG